MNLSLYAIAKIRLVEGNNPPEEGDFSHAVVNVY